MRECLKREQYEAVFRSISTALSLTKEIAFFVPHAYFSSVTHKVFHISCRILLGCQLALMGADFAHTDILVVGGSPPAIESHNCGSREIHKPLDSDQPCLPCYRNTHSFVFSDGTTFSAPIVRMSLAVPDRPTWREVSTASSVPKRGPPILTAI